MTTLSRQQKKLLGALRQDLPAEERPWLLNTWLSECVCLRYGARIGELRELGYVIEKNCIKRGLWEYRLVSIPDPGDSDD